MGVACLNFVEKIFADDCKSAKFVKVFSLESFPLYGIISRHVSIFLNYPYIYLHMYMHIRTV